MPRDTSDFALTRTRGQDILVRVPENARLTCARCGELLLSTTVALYSRTTHGAPLEPWCVRCAEVLIRWAALGANSFTDLEETE
jgi:hypothetical protein